MQKQTDPSIMFIRHGQSTSNAKHKAKIKGQASGIRNDPQNIDAGLSSEGKAQCIEKGLDFAQNKRVKIVLVSPLLRALETAYYMFNSCPAKPQLIVIPQLAEILSSATDIGRLNSKDNPLFQRFDFSLLDESTQNGKVLWNIANLTSPDMRSIITSIIDTGLKDDYSTSKYQSLGPEILLRFLTNSLVEPQAEFEKRCQIAQSIIHEYFENYLADKKNDIIAVVTHDKVIRYLTSGLKLENAQIKIHPLNCENHPIHS